MQTFFSLRKPILTLLGLLGAVSLYWVIPKFIEYYFTYPVPMLAGISLAIAVNAPTLLILAYIMRGRAYSKLTYLLVPLSVLVYFGLMTSITNNWFRTLHISEFIFAGISEETWKIMPLLLILFIGKLKITEVRDGIFYGALAGYGFSALEMGAYFAFTQYPDTGWTYFFRDSLARATFFGADLHIVWSAFLGGAIVYGLQRKELWKRFLVITGGYLLVVFTHSIQDIYGKIITAVSFDLITPLFTHFGVTQEQLAPYIIPLLLYAGSFNLLVVNIVILPLLFWMLFSSVVQ